MKIKIRDLLFKGFEPCHNIDCIIRKPKGMHTNGSCNCLRNLNGAQITIVTSRLKQISNEEIEII